MISTANDPSSEILSGTLSNLSVDLGSITLDSIPDTAFRDDGVWIGNAILSTAGIITITATNSGKTGSDMVDIYHQINYATDAKDRRN